MNRQINNAINKHAWMLLFSFLLFFLNCIFKTASHVGYNDIPVHLLFFSVHRFEKKTLLNQPGGLSQSLLSSYSENACRAEGGRWSADLCTAVNFFCFFPNTHVLAPPEKQKHNKNTLYSI